MKLEVGMYVRFDYHRVTVPIQISKIKEKHYEDIEKYYYYLTDNGLVISEEQIIKASHNIIDLIEIGDYINGYKVSFKGNDYQPFVQCDYPVEEGTTNHYRFYEEAIYSIVTKEQFESMSYKVGNQYVKDKR